MSFREACLRNRQTGRSREACLTHQLTNRFRAAVISQPRSQERSRESQMVMNLTDRNHWNESSSPEGILCKAGACLVWNSRVLRRKGQPSKQKAAWLEYCYQRRVGRRGLAATCKYNVFYQTAVIFGSSARLLGVPEIKCSFESNILRVANQFFSRSTDSVRRGTIEDPF